RAFRSDYDCERPRSRSSRAAVQRSGQVGLSLRRADMAIIRMSLKVAEDQVPRLRALGGRAYDVRIAVFRFIVFATATPDGSSRRTVDGPPATDREDLGPTLGARGVAASAYSPACTRPRLQATVSADPRRQYASEVPPVPFRDHLPLLISQTEASTESPSSL